MNNSCHYKATFQRSLPENTSLGHRDAQAHGKDISREAGMPAKGVLPRYTINNKKRETICPFVNEQHFFANLTGFYNYTVSERTINRPVKKTSNPLIAYHLVNRFSLISLLFVVLS